MSGVVCPYCAFEHIPYGDEYEFWEPDTGFEFDCPKCDKPYQVGVHTEIAWHTEELLEPSAFGNEDELSKTKFVRVDNE